MHDAYNSRTLSQQTEHMKFIWLASSSSPGCTCTAHSPLDTLCGFSKCETYIGPMRADSKVFVVVQGRMRTKDSWSRRLVVLHITPGLASARTRHPPPTTTRTAWHSPGEQYQPTSGSPAWASGASAWPTRRPGSVSGSVTTTGATSRRSVCTATSSHRRWIRDE